MFSTRLHRRAVRRSHRNARSGEFSRALIFLEELEGRLAPSADLSVSQVANPSPVVEGNQLTYTITVKNNGPDNATGVTLTDMLPTGASYVSSTTSQGTLTPPGTVTTKSLDEDVFYTLNTNPSVWKIHFKYDGSTLTASNNVKITALPGADGLIFNPDGSLLVGGQGSPVYKVDATTGKYKTASSGVGAFHMSADPSGTQAWASGIPGTPSSIPLNPFGNGTPHKLTGDNTKIDTIVFAPNGTAYYTSSPPNGPGDIGVINLTTFTTTRYIANLPAAHGLAFDPYTSDLVAFGHGHITQINPNTMRVISDLDESGKGYDFDQGNTDGFGHAFVASDNTGKIFFLDYSASGLVGATTNVVSAPFVNNDDDDVAPGAGLGSRPPVLTASLGNLANGATATVTIVVQVNSAVIGSLSNTASVTGDQTDSDLTNNTSTLVTPVTASADLAVTQSVDTTTALETSRVFFTVTVTNNGPSAATSVTVSDPLPSGLDFVNYAGTNGSSYDSGSGLWSVGSLAPGASATLTLVAAGNASAVGTTQTNTATVAGADQPDPVSTNNSASASVTISAAKFVLSLPANATAGTSINAKLTVEDGSGNVATHYHGIVYLTSSDTQAVLPEDYGFVDADGGIHTFAITLGTAGSQTLSVQAGGLVSHDKPVSASGWHSEPDLSFGPNHVTDGRLDDTLNPSGYSFWLTRPGTLDNFTVDLEGQYPISRIRLQNTHTYTYNSYETRRFSISVSADGANFTTVLESGLKNVFGMTGALPIQHWDIVPTTARYVRFQVLTYSGTGGGLSEIFVQVAPTLSATGTTVVAPGKVAALALALPSGAIAGGPFSATVEAVDAYGNIVPTYAGTVHFTKTDPKGTIPANYVFKSSDQGVHTFTNGVTFFTAGSQALRATDVKTSTITGKSSTAVSPAAAATFTLVAPANIVAGVALPVKVTVKDAFGNVVTGYTGTVHFTSSDAAADLPDDYTFTGAENGQASFTVVFNTGGTQTVTVTDTAFSNVTGSTSVSVAAVTHFGFSMSPTTVAGTTVSVTVTALDANGKAVTNYVGSIHFTSTDPHATVPADYAFTAGDKGVHTFNAVFITAGSRSLKVADTVVTWLASHAPIKVTPAAAASFFVAAPTFVTLGVPFNLTVTVLDAYKNIVTGYSGTIQFTSSDSAAGLPGNYTFVSSDNGKHAFTATLNSLGAQTITATDTALSTLTGSATTNVDTPAAPSIVLPGRSRPGRNTDALAAAAVSAFFSDPKHRTPS
jgi:uncharacterized repeat protein (TIGR01451 family)